MYASEVRECQRLMRSLRNIPEVYWVKGHSGVPGNERADAVAKRAMRTAREQQPQLVASFSDSGFFTHSVGLEQPFRSLWEKEWQRNDDTHMFSKRLFPRLFDIQPLYVALAKRLSFPLRKLWGRLLTGKVGLNQYLFYQAGRSGGYPAQAGGL